MSTDSKTPNRAERLEPLAQSGNRPGPPPLRIHHLMACAAVAAVQFSLWRVLYPQTPSQVPVANAAMMAVGGSLSAIGLTLAIFSVYWHAKGFAGLVQPGQWLLMGFAFSALRNVLTLMWVMSITAAPGGSRSSWWMLWSWMLFTTTFLVPFLFYAWCAWKVADTWPWRIAFAVMAISPVFTSGMMLQLFSSIAIANFQVIVWSAHIGRGVILILVEGWAAVSDLRTLRSRYWTHWAGVGLSLLVQLSSIVGVMAFLLYRL
jgi:hypothetical protein